MYYGDLTAPPPPHESWDADWGGIHGIPDGWKDWSAQEIQRLAEERAGVTLHELASVADEVREECEPLQREALTVLSPAGDVVGSDRERAILEKIDGITWITPPANFIQAIAPKQMMTRDMHAMSPGLQAPSHLAVETSIVSNTSTLATSRETSEEAALFWWEHRDPDRSRRFSPRRRLMPRKAKTAARGYGGKHKDRRKRWERVVAAGGVVCARCGGLILPGTAWDLGHNDVDRMLPTHPEHRHCNRSAAAAHGNTLRAKQPAELPPVEGRWSRVW